MGKYFNFLLEKNSPDLEKLDMETALPLIKDVYEMIQE